MKIIISEPPNIDLIDAKFNIKNKPIIFTYGSIIYNPMNIVISNELMTHEQAHSDRQTSNIKQIEDWWEKYLNDDEFRLYEELLAHKAEYKEYCKNYKDRNNRNLFLNNISQRLASSMYGNLLTPSIARKKIIGG